MSADVIVVGGGIVGACCARWLARAGASVELYERRWPASGASGACEGNILAWDKETATELPLALRSRMLWDELAEELEDDFEFERKGSIVVAEDEGELEAATAQAESLRRLGVQGEPLDVAALRAEEPACAPDLPGGVLYPGDAQVEPRLATNAIVACAQRHGGRLRSAAAVRTLARDGSGAVAGVLLEDGRRVAAGTVVVAAGAHTGELLGRSGLELPVRARQGQIVVADAAPAGGRFARKLNEAGYLSAVGADDPGLQVAMVVESTRSGTLLLGSSRRLAGHDTSADPRVAAAIAARAVRFFPVLARARALRVYAGLRPFTPDHLPIVGSPRAAPGLVVATGHEGAGIGLAPATGELVRDLVTGSEPRVDAAGLHPDRFGAPLA